MSSCVTVSLRAPSGLLSRLSSWFSSWCSGSGAGSLRREREDVERGREGLFGSGSGAGSGLFFASCTPADGLTGAPARAAAIRLRTSAAIAVSPCANSTVMVVFKIGFSIFLKI
ncbi:hypothetical protein K0H02_05530 [Bacteroides fragilis]|nr:hypothetical protein [Bacteroides fragilis]